MLLGKLNPPNATLVGYCDILNQTGILCQCTIW